MLRYEILATTQFYPTTAHKEKHILKYDNAVKDIFMELREIELTGEIERLCKGRICAPSFRRLN